MHSLPDEANPQEQNRRILMFSGVITTCQSLNGNLSTTEDLSRSSHNLERYFKSENLYDSAYTVVLQYTISIIIRKNNTKKEEEITLSK